MAKEKRMANYELLRILAMIMVLTLHFLSHSDRLIALGVPLDGVRIIGSLLEAFCLVAVNVYLLISGYFGVKGSFKPGRAISLLCQIWFYSLLIPLVLKIIGIPILADSQGIYGLIQYVFPIETEHYWFATSYFLLYLFTPVLNQAVRSMNKRQLQITLGGLFILFCVIKSFSPFVFAFDRYGYDLPWFLCVYLLAAYFGLYGGGIFERKGWLIYIVSCLGSFSINLLMWMLSGKWDSFSYYFTVPYHYNFILCLAGAVGLFFGFSKVQIKEGRMAEIFRKLGVLSFGIYLFHEHIDLRDKWYGWLKKLVNPQGKGGVGFFLLEFLFCVVVLFVVGILIDFIRGKLFALSAIWLRKTKAGRAVSRLDAEMAEGRKADA
ncbi:MAG: acyltransferase [Lachnospiraceae bacterium]|nr:acyltransferase [Lachnospiraceae bacterium]